MTAKKSRTKKVELKPSAPQGSRASALVSRLSSNATAYTAGDMLNRWRWIDFINPHYNCPCLALEWFFGSRGLLAGRVIQFRAKYSKGKSSFMYFMYAAAQRTSDAFCFHVETEGAIAPADYIYSFGCDPDNLAVAEHSSLEECCTNMDEVIATIRGGFDGQKGKTGQWKKTVYTDPLDAEMKVPIIMGVDSFSALGLDQQVREDVADMTSTPGLASHSRKVRDFLRRRTQRWKQNDALVMLTSHETASINTGPAAFGGGVKKSALAQEAIGIHATYIVDVNSKPWKDKTSGERIGDIVTMVTEKNKMSPRGRSVELYLRWNHGFDMLKTDAEFLLKHSASPHADGSKRDSGGITCKAVSTNKFKTEVDLMEAFYGNTDLLQGTREGLRIRGHGFDFEAHYKPTEAELADNIKSAESEIDGVEGSPDPPQGE
jgi:RecA/RadA recombinase